MIPAVTALLLLPPVLTAGGGGDDSSAWLELDREIASLAAAPLPAEGEGPKISVDAILSYQYSEDDFYTGGTGENVSGVVLRRVRSTFQGSFGDYSYKVSGDLAGGVMSLRDAYATWACCELLDVTIGRYKGPLLWSGRVSSFADPFHDVQVTGAQNDERQAGVMLESTIAAFDLLLSLQNGVNGIDNEGLIVGRVQWNLIGENAFGKWHGAYGYGEETQLSAAVGFSDDGAIDNGSATAAEAALVMSSLSLRADAVQYDKNYDVATGLDLDPTLGTSKADTTPMAVTLGYLFGDDEWEALARQESFDDVFKTVRTSFGIVHYTEFGPKLRWALLFQDMSSDLPDFDGHRVEVSLSLAGS
jgi:hypothetical protein